MKNIISILIIFLTIQGIYSFQLQGQWSLIEIQSFPTIYQSVSIEISDSIYHQTSIIQNLTITGCQSYKYLLQSNQNNLFIKYSSFQYDTKIQQTGNSTIKCTDNAVKMHTSIKQKLIEVFYFQIIGNYLVLLNPNKQVVFKFQRIQSVKVRNLRGIWNLYSLKSTQVSQKVEIADTQITLCQGKLIVGYVLNDKYGFKTRSVSNDGCDVKDLQKIVLTSAYSRKIGTSLEVYNSASQLIMLMEFVQDLDLTSVQQARQKAIADAKVIEDKAAQVQAQADAKAKADAQAQTKTQAQSLTSSLTLTNTKDDLLGLWQPVSIFSMPLQGSSIYFIFSTNIISYNGGCNTYQFQYTVNESSKSIQVGQNKSTSDTCDVDDDGLYVNGMNRVSKYAVSIVGNQFRLKISNSSGSVVYQLKKTVKVTSNSSNTVNSSNSINNTSTSQNNTTISSGVSIVIPGLQSGKYVFLILARRDLPRKFCTITESKITYTGCNIIEHTYKVTGQGQLKISGGPVTNSNCTVNNDEILSNAFNSITTFTSGVQTGSYVLKNVKNQQIINLSLF